MDRRSNARFGVKNPAGAEYYRNGLQYFNTVPWVEERKAEQQRGSPHGITDAQREIGRLGTITRHIAHRVVGSGNWIRPRPLD